MKTVWPMWQMDSAAAMNRERALDIMKDSRVGAFGAIAVMLALLCKVALLALLGSLNIGLMVAAVFAGHVVSRTWPLLTIRLLPHVGDSVQSKSKPLAGRSRLVLCRWRLFGAFLR